MALHWMHDLARTNRTSYQIHRSVGTNLQPALITPNPLSRPHFVDFDVTNGQTYFYRIREAGTRAPDRAEFDPVKAIPKSFDDDDEFLDLIQQTAFDYFWYEANPANGLIRDRSRSNSYCSIAAVGFGLTAIGIGIDHGWITREQGCRRALDTLKTFWEKPQRADAVGVIGYRGWFYHFLDMNTGLRGWKCELSSIDTALLLAGMVYAREYFDQANTDEATIRELVNRISRRVEWRWMTGRSDSPARPPGTGKSPLATPNGEPAGDAGKQGRESATLSMGWRPESGFIPSRWIGYNEAMILLILGLGAELNPLSEEFWKAWCSGYQWKTSYGQDFIHFPPLFGHQYSHCWIDFRGLADDYLRAKGIDYFENSRRATLAQRAYCIQNPGRFKDYGEFVWGLTACDGPGTGRFRAYSARGAPPAENDDGTIAPTAVGGSLAFAPEVCLSALRHFYERYRANIWTPYGFCDAFNRTADWWDPEVLGIDQGPILIMIENHRTGRVWRTFMRAVEIQRGLKAAGFRPIKP